MSKIKMKEVVGGFTERDSNSKALLNTDKDSLLKYKIQKRIRSETNFEIESVKRDVVLMKNELSEIKELLLSIAKPRE
jgi:hypothetical protein